MSFDLNIISIKQKEAIDIDSTIVIKKESDQNLRYKDIWPTLKQIEGCWYSLGHNSDGLFNAMSLIDTNFDKTAEIKPSWIKNSEVIENLTPLYVMEDQKDELERVIERLIDSSPVKKMIFLARYQGGDLELIEGTLSLELFIKLLGEEKLSFNVCYIIAKE